MYSLIKTKKFLKDLKKIIRSGADISCIDEVIVPLINGKKLPSKYKDHQLKGDMSQYRECHIKSDLLLVYEKRNDILVLILVRIGSHNQVFGK